MRELLGGKGAGLHEMTRIGIPVPPGFTITTEVCRYYYDHDRRYPKELGARVEAGPWAQWKKFRPAFWRSQPIRFWFRSVQGRANPCRE